MENDASNNPSLCSENPTFEVEFSLDDARALRDFFQHPEVNITHDRPASA